jgi:tRNA(Ile)-lysidine synthase
MSFLQRFQSALESLYRLPVKSSYVIAYSGGVDSHVLLYCCAKLNVPVRAVHVHHGLQSVADEWVTHCKKNCEQLSVHLDIVYVDATQKKSKSPEEAARDARYQALSDCLQEGDCLITAQHQNDQAETVLLQLFRTANTAGLSAMPDKKLIGEHVQIRPLLSFSRAELVNFALENNLQWIEDPSNQDKAFDRNYVRADILPRLIKRWPAMVTQLATVAELQSNNLSVLEDMAAIDLANVITEPDFQSIYCRYEVLSVLSIPLLTKLSDARLFNLLRYWVLSIIDVSPTRNLLLELQKTLIEVQADANSVLTYAGFEYRKYQDKLFLLKKTSELDDMDIASWNPAIPLGLSGINIRMTAVKTMGAGLKLELLDEVLTIKFRQGGERFHPAYRQHSQRLKKLLQEEGVPPWERSSFPLLYYKGECVAVIGLWMAKHHVVDEDSEGWKIDAEVL